MDFPDILKAFSNLLDSEIPPIPPVDASILHDTQLVNKALKLARIKNDHEMVRRLLGQKLRNYSRGIDSDNPIVCASKYGALDTIKCLSKYANIYGIKFDESVLDEALEVAKNEGHSDVVEYLNTLK